MLLGDSIFLLPNGTFFVELILFLLIFGFVAKVILPPLKGAMDERAQTVRAAQEASDEGQAEADRLVKERHDVLDGARTEARSILDAAAAEAERLYEEGRDRGLAERDEALAEAQPRLERERSSVEVDLLSRVNELVASAAGRVVGEPVDAMKHAVLIERVVANFDSPGATQ